MAEPFISLADCRHRFVPDEQGYDACRLSGGSPDDCGRREASLIHQPLPPYDWGIWAKLAALVGYRLPRGPRWALDSVADSHSMRADIYAGLVLAREHERVADADATGWFPR